MFHFKVLELASSSVVIAGNIEWSASTPSAGIQVNNTPSVVQGSEWQVSLVFNKKDIVISKF